MTDEPLYDDAWLDLERLAQYMALAEGVCCVELTDWTNISFMGRDAKKFLNNFCTNDVNRLAPGQNCEAFFTNVKGKIVGHGVITCRDDELALIGPPSQALLLIEHLSRYVIREDVEIWDRSTERICLLIGGGSAERGAVVALAPTASAGNALLQPNVNEAGMFLDVPVHWVHWNLIGSEFSGIIEFVAINYSRFKGLVAERRWMEQSSMDAFHVLRIEAGVPLFGVDFDERNFPQEVGRDEQAISFTKGCYLGQETVARIDALGHVNQRIVGVKFSGQAVPAAGAELSASGAAVGNVTSATFSPRLAAPLALALVRREYMAVGSRLDSPVGPGEVIRLPLDS
jgi:folate-binding protein YgfZ